MKRTLLVFGSAVLFIVILTSSIKSPNRINYSDGSQVTGYSGGCTSCHGNGLTAGSVAITGIPASTVTGTTYPFSVVITSANTKAWGFDLKVSKGTLATSNVNSALTGTTNLHHGTSPAIATANSYTFDQNTWKAPATAGAITFTYAANAANNDGGTGGDHCYKGTFSTSVVLPITLASFIAFVEGNNVKLSWTTSKEINANSFVIEKSTNGQDFIQAGEVRANGNTNASTNYSFSEIASVLNGTIYYRLKTIDKDGSSSYSETKSIVVKSTKKFIAEIYPNPIKAGRDVNVKFVSAQVDKATLQVIGANGKRFVSLNSNVNAGTNILSLKTSGLSSGTYYLIATGKDNEVQKIPFVIK